MEKEIDIYAVNTANKLEDELYKKFLSYVDEDKRKKINRFQHNADKVRALIGDVLVRSIISSKMKRPNEELEYEYNDYGKPALKNNEGFQFNLSHSGDWVVSIAGHSKAVGIDIEEMCHIDYINIADSFFHKDEYNWLLAQKENERLESFYKLWTLKESYIKMLGTGLSLPLNSFSIILKDCNNISIKDNDSFMGERYLKTYILDRNYALSVCSQNSELPLKIHSINYEDLNNKLIRTK